MIKILDEEEGLDSKNKTSQKKTVVSSNKESITLKDIEDLETFIQRVEFEDIYEEMTDFINDFLLWNLKKMN